jgi:acyl-homoserine lactone acylase PvdQ
MADPELVNHFPAPAAMPTPRTRKRRWLRVLVWSVVGLIAVLVVAAGASVLWMRSVTRAALPQLDGSEQVSGLSAPVTVARDEHGVPHISAATQDDLWVAQGYVTAQDRLWQMDTLRRNANGELAEILGRALLKHDEAQRVLEIRNTARRVYANLPAEERVRFDDYARGVNLFIAQHQDSLPPEFRLLFYKPQPWSGADSISVGLMMVQTLDTHWDVKLGRERVSADLHNAKIESDLYPVGSWRDHPPTGIQVDLSQPQPIPPPVSDDEDDEKTQAGAGAHSPSIEESKLNRTQASQVAGSRIPIGQVSGHDLTRAEIPAMLIGALAPEDSAGTSGAQAPSAMTATTYGLKTVPFTVRLIPAQEMSCPRRSTTADPSTRPAPRGFAQDDRRTLLTQRSIKPESFAGPGPANEDLGNLRALLGLPTCAGCVAGSNNWVISGKHTASGRPLLSNDMHLDLSVPNIWYMADLRAPGYHAAGVTLPGFPFVIAGHNEHLAWGFTALLADAQDLYFEKLDGNGNYQAQDGTWKPLGIDRETIRVRGGRDVTMDVQSTAHGPLLNPILRQKAQPIALKWTLYDPAFNTLPVYAMNTASNWAEFSTALSHWYWPTQNVVYSDDQGHIAYHAVGAVPIRPGGLMGVPVNEMDNRHEWQGYIPFDDLPNAFDPPSGFLATANSRVTTDKSPYPLTLEWVDPYRIERIYKLLQGRDGLTPNDMLAVQTDIYSEVDQELAHRFAYAIDHTAGVDDRLRKAADLMRSWDGRLSIDSAAASLVTQTRAALARILLESKLGKDAKDYSWAESNFAEEEIVMHAKPDWLPKGYKDWDALLTDAVREGMKRGKAPNDVSQWSYGSWHVIDLEHPLGAFLPYIGRIAGTGPQPLSGDTITVKQVGRAFGPSQRFTMDWSNIDGSTEDIVLGESGNPLSPYFRDQWKDYYGGTTFALPFSAAAVKAHTRHMLLLTP